MKRMVISTGIHSTPIKTEFEDPPVKKKKKKRNRTENEDLTEPFRTDELAYTDTDDMLSSSIVSSEVDEHSPKKKKKKKKKFKDEDDESIENPAPNVQPGSAVNRIAINGVLSEETPTEPALESWPKECLAQLIDRIEEKIPEKDTLKYSSRVSKLDWNAICFANYSADDCQRMWKSIQCKIRCYRLLKEMLADARQHIDKHESKKSKHPDEPTKPLSSFMLFFKDVKDKIRSQHPGIDGAEVSKRTGELWKSVSEKKREKYKMKAQKLREEYDQKLKEFHENHPEVKKQLEQTKKNSKKKTGPFGIEKPKSAFRLYYDSCKAKLENKNEEVNFLELTERCKNKWKSMTEKKKGVWIMQAMELENDYKKNLKKYELDHPGSVMPEVKSLITKSDKKILNQLAGVPQKPPNSAYSLYSKIMLGSDLMKSVPTQDRLKEISNRWKDLAPSEKLWYQKECEKVQKEYEEAYQVYVNSLSPEEKSELERLAPRKKKPSSSKKKVLLEPEKPPESEFELFKQRNQDEWAKNTTVSVQVQASAKWRTLNDSEKRKYRKELEQMKNEYPIKLAEFLKQCSPEKIVDVLMSQGSIKSGTGFSSVYTSSEED